MGNNITIPVPLKNPKIPQVVVILTQFKKLSFLDIIYPLHSPYVAPPIPPPYNTLIIAISLTLTLSFLCDLLQNVRKRTGGIVLIVLIVLCILCKPNMIIYNHCCFILIHFLQNGIKMLHGIFYIRS